MSPLTIRLPDGTAARLKILANSPGLSMNKLIEEIVVVDAKPEAQAFYAQVWFRALHHFGR